MDFHKYDTLYSYVKRNLNKKQLKEVGLTRNVDHFYNKLMDVGPGESDGDLTVLINQSFSEALWYESDKPYFQVRPEFIETFSECSLEVPAKLIEFPNNLDVFSVDLPSVEEGNPFVINDQHYVKSILVHRSNDSKLESFSQRRGIIRLTREDPRERITLWVDIGEKDIPAAQAFFNVPEPFPVRTYRQLAFSNDDSVDDALSALSESQDFISETEQETLLKCVRLVMSLCFLMQSEDPLVEPIVLAKDVDKNIPLKDKVQRAKKRGQYGWRFASFGHELNFSHLRKGHWHTVRYGPGKSLTKVKWYHQITVRKDLPSKSKEM